MIKISSFFISVPIVKDKPYKYKEFGLAQKNAIQITLQDLLGAQGKLSYS